MLLCENLGRRHESALKAVFRAGVNQRGGNSGLARADVALKQSVHGFFAHHILHGFVYASLLCKGRSEGEKRIELFGIILIYNAGVTACLIFCAKPQQPHLKIEKLVKNQSAPPRFKMGVIPRKMYRSKRFLQRTQLIFTKRFFGKGFRYDAVDIFNRLSHTLLDRL